MWPCGCYMYPTDTGINPEKCPKCFPEPIRTYLLSEPKHVGNVPARKDVPSRTAGFDYLYGQAPLAIVGKPSDALFKLYQSYREIAKKYNATITSLHDEVEIDAPPENIRAVMEEMEKAQMTYAASRVNTDPFFLPAPVGGKFDVNSPPGPRQIPRKESKEKWTYDKTMIGHDPGAKKGDATAFVGVMTGRMSCKDSNLSTDEDKDYQNRDRVFDEMVLRTYELSQHFSDAGKDSFFKTGKQYREAYPRASEVWSAALRAKINESEQKAKAQENAHWNPYGDWED